MKVTSPTLYCDLETFSAKDIRAGSHAYAADPSAEVLLWGYAIDDAPAKVWDVTAGPMPEELRTALDEVARKERRHVWQNGVMFDRVFLSYVMPEIELPMETLDDTMVMAYQAGLPGSLKELCEVFHLSKDKAKDADGSRLIQIFCKPLPSTWKLDRATSKTHPEEWAKFVNYCRLDIESMREVYKKLPAFNRTAKERELQVLDATINMRGIGVDVEFAEAAIATAERAKKDIDKQVFKLTDGRVVTAGQRDALIQFFFDKYGWQLKDMRKSELEKRMEDPDIPDEMKELIGLRLMGTKTSVQKYKRVVDGAVFGTRYAAVDDRVRGCGCFRGAGKSGKTRYPKPLFRGCPDIGRLKGCMQFRGASRTGRLCLTGDHEVLTEQGWVRLDQWQGGRILVWNKDSEALSFQESAAVSYDYEGEMYEYNTVRCAQISTPDHKMAYLTKDGRWGVATVEQLAKMNRPKIPFTGTRKQPTTAEHDLLRTLIMIQADGHYTSDGQLVFRFKKDRKVQRCKSLLRRLGIPFVVDTYEDGATRIGIMLRHLPLALRLFKGKEYGYWLFNESADIIFDELPEWDGYRCGPNSIQYCTKSKHNADLVQALACMSGRTATQLLKKPQKDHWSDVYVVNIWNTPGQGHELRDKPTLIKNWQGKIYCAMTPTGFFMVRREGKVWVTGNSGRTFQPQNLPRPLIKSQAEIEQIIEYTKLGILEVCYDDVSVPLSSAIRSVIVPAAGNRLCVADFSNVEGRVLAWLAGEEWKLEAFREFDTLQTKDGGWALPYRDGWFQEWAVNEKGDFIHKGHDLYKLTYARTFGIKPEDVTKDQRQMGKVLELALGYQGGPRAFATFAMNFGMDLDELAKTTEATIEESYWIESMGMLKWAKEKKLIRDMSQKAWVACNAIKLAWRKANSEIVSFWYALAKACQSAIKAKGVAFSAGRIVCKVSGNYLLMRLPSGRYLVYPAPRLPEEGEMCDFSFMGVNQYTKKWERIPTYSGKLAENSVQGAACDLLLEAGPRLEAAGYHIVMSVHDEYITEIKDDNTRNHREMEKIMSDLPDWAEGLPLVAAGFEAARYRKD